MSSVHRKEACAASRHRCPVMEELSSTSGMCWEGVFVSPRFQELCLSHV